LNRFKEREENVKADIFHAYRALLRQTKPSILINTNQVRVLSFFSPRIKIHGAKPMRILIRILSHTVLSVQDPYRKLVADGKKQCCGSALVFVRIRIQLLFSLGIKTMLPPRADPTPEFYIFNFLTFISQQSQFTMFFLSFKQQRGHVFLTAY
jgi:hypothetical protein